MNTDKFFSIEIVDKFSRIFMLMFAGIVLGCVLAVACYNLTAPGIMPTLLLLVIYCTAFTCYAALTSAGRQVTKIEILKDRLALIFEKKGQVSKRKEILYSNIKEYKITPGSDSKNLALKTPKKDKFSLRIFGFRTAIQTKDGEKTEFSDSKSDGVLIYSPAYVYRMIDLKRYVKDFPLVLENFDTKKDSEAFNEQFEYYEQNEKNLPLFKNKNYVHALVKYITGFVIVAAIIAAFIAYVVYIDIQDLNRTAALLLIALCIILIVILPTCFAALCGGITGEIANKTARQKIKEVTAE